MDKGASGITGKMRHSMWWMARKVGRGHWHAVCVSGAEPPSTYDQGKTVAKDSTCGRCAGAVMGFGRSTGTQGQGSVSDPRDQLAPT